MSDCRKNDIASVLKTAEAHNAPLVGRIDTPTLMRDLALTRTIIDKVKEKDGMGMNEYQKLAQVTVVYPSDMKIIYPLIGLCGETGEVAEKIKKWIRDNNRETMSPETLDLLKKELGDVLWYLAVLARDLGLSLDEIAKDNIQKLHDRKERGMVHGKGDVR